MHMPSNRTMRAEARGTFMVQNSEVKKVGVVIMRAEARNHPTPQP